MMAIDCLKKVLIIKYFAETLNSYEKIKKKMYSFYLIRILRIRLKFLKYLEKKKRNKTKKLFNLS